MPGDPDPSAEWRANKRDFVADSRDSAADERDAAADARDVVAGAREAIADAREARLLALQQELEGRARRLGLVRDGDRSSDTEAAEAAAGRDVAETAREARAAERRQATKVRDEATAAGLAERRDTLLAAAFAGIAEHLQQAETPDDLLTRVAEAAVTIMTGASRARVTPEDATPDQTTADVTGIDMNGPDGTGETLEVVLSFPFTTTSPTEPESRTATLEVFADEPGGFDQAAEDIGLILAAHATLAARTVGERVRLEQLVQQLEKALLSRDVIGQAKGTLMERLKTTPDDAFDILKRSSQRLNIKLREVARTLTETGQVDPGDL